MGIYNRDDNNDSSSKADGVYSDPVQGSMRDPLKVIHNTIKTTANYGHTALDLVKDMNDVLEGITYRFNNQLVAKGIPSVGQYNECVSKDGLQVWDTNGWWHCVFPRGVGTGLSKEDIEEDVDNKLGFFFKDLKDMYHWHNSCKDNSKDNSRWVKRVDSYVETNVNGDVTKRVVHREIDSDGNVTEWSEDK